MGQEILDVKRKDGNGYLKVVRALTRLPGAPVDELSPRSRLAREPTRFPLYLYLVPLNSKSCMRSY